MNDATKDALNTFVQQMLRAAETGATWGVEQAPLIVQEWLRWQLASASLMALFGLSVGVFAMMQTWWHWREWEDDAMPQFVFVPLLAILAGGMGTIGLMTAIKVLISPRVVLLEKFAELIK